MMTSQEDVLNKSRTEDAAIAYTWYHYFDHQDQPEYILRLPMTKVGGCGGWVELMAYGLYLVKRSI